MQGTVKSPELKEPPPAPELISPSRSGWGVNPTHFARKPRPAPDPTAVMPRFMRALKQPRTKLEDEGAPEAEAAPPKARVPLTTTVPHTTTLGDD